MQLRSVWRTNNQTTRRTLRLSPVRALYSCANVAPHRNAQKTIIRLVEACRRACFINIANDSWRRSCDRSCLFVLFVCLSVCMQDYCKSNQPISVTLDVMIGPTSRKNRVTFSGDPASDTDSGSLSPFRHYCRIGHFTRFISISHAVTGRLSRNLAKWLMTYRWQGN